MLTWFWSQRSLNLTGSPEAVKMLTSPRVSTICGLYWELETLGEVIECLRLTLTPFESMNLGEELNRVAAGKA